MHKEQGFISIITASIIMVILTLIVISFSQIMRREQRQAIDRQLSSQAIYAAETAVNDFYAKLQTDPSSIAEENKVCDVTDWPSTGANGAVYPIEGNEASYTCLLWDQTPETIEFSNGGVTTQRSKIFQIYPKYNATGGSVKDITFSWSGAQIDNALTLPGGPGCGNRLPTSNPNGVPILRLDLLRLPTGDPINTDTVINQTASVFLYPQASCGANSTAYNATLISPDKKGQTVDVRCNNPGRYACEFTFDTPIGGQPLASDRFYVRVKSIYNDADMSVSATCTGCGGGGQAELLGAQVAIDSTGKSTDVLRRIDVRIGNPSYPIPEFVAQSMDGICKTIQIRPLVGSSEVLLPGCS